MKEEELVALLVRLWSGESDAVERQQLEKWAEEDPGHRRLLDKISRETDLKAEISLWNRIDPAEGYNKWLLWVERRRRARVRRIVGWSVAAASVLVAVVAGLVYPGRHPGNAPDVVEIQKAKEIKPGTNKAILTLANGSKLVLDSVNNGTIAQQGGTVIEKKSGGAIAYIGTGEKGRTALFNEVSTPVGGQYSLILEDGTKVWLNAASSIRFPAAFNGSERKVEISGEAYLEVTHDRLRPFHVIADGMNIDVLGTRFNINSYGDEPLKKTTLLEGKIRVSAGTSSEIVLPAEQAQIDGSNHVVVSRSVNAESSISWKNGFFEFNDTDIRTVMRELARWYNVKVQYNNDVPKALLSGSISRENELSVVLKVLQTGGIHFKLVGDVIVVLP
jgi:ferric-dicitrate binding protein FerR (iron transport regulator)